LTVYYPTKRDIDRILMSEIAAYNPSKELERTKFVGI